MTGSFDDLAAVALLGAARRQLSELVLPPVLAAAAADVRRHRASGAAAGAVRDPAGDLLDVAALATVLGRAGRRCAPPRPLPEPSPPDPRRAAAPAAAARLGDLLGGADHELLELWLTTAALRGVRPPEHALPRLLDHAVRVPALASAIAEACGPRGRWLARHRPDWAAAMPGAAGGAPGAVDGELGTPPQRLAWLAGLRAGDAAAAREKLAAGWAREAPAERAGLLGVLADGLSLADEPFLERCLDDRRSDVRATAARLLTILPGSALGRRAAERARRAVRREGGPGAPRPGGPPARLVVSVPGGDDQAMARDQIPLPARLAPDAGPGGWLLLHVVAAAPLRTWVPGLGTDPAAVVELEVADGWGPVLWLGWARAAAREHDVRWAEALLGAPPPSGSAPGRAPATVRGPLPDLTGTVDALLGVLPERRRAARVAAAVRDGDLPIPLAALLRALPGPWPREVTVVVLGWLDDRPRLDDPDGRAVLELAARRLPGPAAVPLRELADRWPPMSASRRLAAAAAELVTLRRTIVEELQ